MLICLEWAGNLCLKPYAYCDKLSYAEGTNIQWNIFFHRRLGATGGTFIDVSDWNAALIPLLCYGTYLSYAPRFKSPYRFVPLNVFIFISHHTVKTCTLKKYTINIRKAADIVQFVTAATWQEINWIQAPEMTFLREVEGCQHMIGFSLKQLGMYENYSQMGTNTGLQTKMDHVRPIHTTTGRLKVR